MTTDQNFEKIYHLVEQFDFNELPDADKSFVINHMSGTEYQNMRDTIKDSKSYFANKSEIVPDGSIYKSLTSRGTRKNIVIRTLNYPLQLYKVAASILIILGITFMIFYKSNPGLSNQLAIHDTIYQKKTDTVYSVIKDTIQIVKTIFLKVSQTTELKPVNTLLANNNIKIDCNKEICPSDIEKITSMVSSNSIVRDSFLNDFTVSLK